MQGVSPGAEDPQYGRGPRLPVRLLIAACAVGIAATCLYVPWEQRSRGQAMALGYAFLWEPPRYATVDVPRIVLTLTALVAMFVVGLVLISAPRRGRAEQTTLLTPEIPNAEAAPARGDGRPPDDQREDAVPGRARANLDLGPGEPQELTLQRQGDETFMPPAAAEAFAAELRAQGRQAEVRPISAFISTVWANPPAAPAEAVGPEPRAASPGRAAPPQRARGELAAAGPSGDREPTAPPEPEARAAARAGSICRR
jgi:hypothetical protein